MHQNLTPSHPLPTNLMSNPRVEQCRSCDSGNVNRKFPFGKVRGHARGMKEKGGMKGRGEDAAMVSQWTNGTKLHHEG